MLSGASWGWSCRMIGDDSSRSDRSARPGEHRPGVLGRATVDERLGPPRRVGRRDPRPGLRGQHGVRGDQRRAQYLLARRPRRAHAVVDHVEAQPVHEVGAGQVVGRHDHPPAHGPALAPEAAVAPRPTRAARRGSSAAGRRAPPSASTCRGTPSSNGKYCGSSTQRGARLQLQESQPDPQHAARLGLQQHLGAAARGFGAVGRRGEHAELPAQPVLLRRRPVGVQQVPLEQHGVGHRADLVQGTDRSAHTAGFLQQAFQRLVPGCDHVLRPVGGQGVQRARDSRMKVEPG